jgi:hypothetical protein
MHWITDPVSDPALSVGGFQDAKKGFFSKLFSLLLSVDAFTSAFKDNKELTSHKTDEIKIFPTFFSCGSRSSRSGTLLSSLLFIFCDILYRGCIVFTSAEARTQYN